MSTVRDRFWIFTCVAGSDNDSLAKGGFAQGSRMTPAEGAFYLGVPNLMLIRWRGLPTLAEFDRYARSFAPLDRVVWSIVGSGGDKVGDEVGPVLDVAERFGNVTGVIMDDFFNAEGGGISVPDLSAVRDRLVVHGKRLDIWVVLYTHQLDLPVVPHLEQCDLISFWTWNADELQDLDQNLARLEQLNPGCRISLGCYIWDFPNRRPVPVPSMQHQCELGLEWLKQGRIDNMVFLANTVCDMGFDSADWTRQWIAEVGDTALG